MPRKVTLAIRSLEGDMASSEAVKDKYSVKADKERERVMEIYNCVCKYAYTERRVREGDARSQSTSQPDRYADCEQKVKSCLCL